LLTEAPEIDSAITIAGFSKERRQQQVKLTKEVFAPVTLKPKATNPWAQLSTAPAATIDESTLLKEDGTTVKKFGCDDDKLTAGKPCENCTCGKKELLEGKITTD